MVVIIITEFVFWKLSDEDIYLSWLSFSEGKGGVIDSTIKPCWVYQSLFVANVWVVLSLLLLFGENVSNDWIIKFDVGKEDCWYGEL